MKAFSDIMKV